MPPPRADSTVPAIPASDVQASLAELFHRSLRPVALGLAVLYAAYVVGHLVVHDGRTAAVLATASGATGLLALAVWAVHERLPATPPWPYAVGAVLVTIVQCNVLLHLALLGDLKQSTSVMLLVVGTGLFYLSTPWYVGLTGGVLASWGAVVYHVEPSGDLVHYGFAVGTALVLATIVHVARRQSVVLRERGRLAGERLRDALARALDAEAATRSALEASNQGLEQAVREAEELNRLQTSFLADMSHEIRTPLTSIIGFAEVLDEDATGETQRFAHLIRQSSRRLLTTVNSVLDLSKLETGTVQLAPRALDVAIEVDEVVTMLRPRADRAGVAVSYHRPLAPVRGRVDAPALHRIGTNLISNAIKFTDDGGRVDVRLTADEATFRLEVADDGVGIDPAFRPYLFEPFHRSDTEDRLRDGTGLGLAITHRLVTLMGGTIHVASAPGEGSTFQVTLPRWGHVPDGRPHGDAFKTQTGSETRRPSNARR